MIKLLIKYRFWFFVLISILGVLTGLKVTSINYDTEFSQFLPDHDPEHDFYKQIKSEIEDDEYLIVLGIENRNEHVGAPNPLFEIIRRYVDGAGVL